jgi:hypothetical protein
VGARRGSASRAFASVSFIAAGAAVALGFFGQNAAAAVTHVDLSVSVTLAASDPNGDQTYDSVAGLFSPTAPTEDVTLPVGALDGLSDITLDDALAGPAVDLAGCASSCTLTIGGTASIPTPLTDVDVDVMVAMRWADDADTSPTVAIAVQVPDLSLSDLVGASTDVDPDLGSVTMLIAPSSWGTVPLDSAEFPEGFGAFLGAETSMELAQGSNLLAQIDVAQNAALEKAASVLGYTGSDPLQFSGVLDDTADPLFAPSDVTLDHLSLTIPMPDAAPAEWLAVSGGRLTFASNAGTLHLSFAGEFTVTAGGVTNVFSLDAGIDVSDTTTGVELHLALAPPQTVLNLPSALDWLSVSSPAIDLSIDTATHSFSASIAGDIDIGGDSVSIGIVVATGNDGTKVDLSLTSPDGVSLSAIADWLSTGDGPFAGGSGIDADALDHISLRAIQLSLENSATAKKLTLVADASFDADTGASLDFGALLSIGQTTDDANVKHNTLLFALEATPSSSEAGAEVTFADFLPDLAGTTAGAMRMPEAGIVLNQGGPFDTSTLTTEGQTVLKRALGLSDDGDLPDAVDHTGLQFFANLDVGWFGDAALGAMGIDPGDPTLHIEGALGFELSAYGDPGTGGSPQKPAPLLTSLDLKASIPAASFSWLPSWVSMSGDWVFEVHYAAAAHAVELALTSPMATIDLPDDQTLDGIQFSAKFKKQTLAATQLTAEKSSNASDDPCTTCTATKETNTSTDAAADQTATFAATCDSTTGEYHVLASGISTKSWGASGTSARVVVKHGSTVVVTTSMPIADGAGDLTFTDVGCEGGNQVLVTGPGAAGNLSLGGSFADETSTFTATCDTVSHEYHVVASGISTDTWGAETEAQIEILNPASSLDLIEPMPITAGAGDVTFTNGAGCVKGTHVYVTGPGADANLSLAGSFGAAPIGTGIDVSVTARLGAWNEPFDVSWLSLRNFELDVNVSQDPVAGTTYDALLKGDIGLGSKTVSAELHVFDACNETGPAPLHPTVSFELSLNDTVTVDDILTGLLGENYPSTLGVTVPDAVASIGFGPAALDVEVCEGATIAQRKVKVGGTAVASFQPNADSTVGIDSMFSAEFTGGTLTGLLFGLKPYCAGPAVHLRDLLPDPPVLDEDSPLNFALCDPDDSDTGFGFVVSTYPDGTTSTDLPAIVKDWMKPLEGLASDAGTTFTLPGPGFSVVASIRLGGDLGGPDGMLDEMGFDNKVYLSGTIGFDPVAVELAMKVNVKGDGLPDWLDRANVGFNLSLSVGPNPKLEIAIDGAMVARVKQGFDEAPDGISVPIADPVPADFACPRNGVVRTDSSTGNHYCYDLLRVSLSATATISPEEMSFAIDASLVSVLTDGMTPNTSGWAPFGLTNIKIGSIHAQIGLEVTPEFGLTFALGGSIQLDLGDGHIINTFAAIKVEVTPEPPWILLDGFRLDVDRFGLSDIVQLYKDISGQQFSTAGIPDVSIHNLDLSFSPLGVPDFCIPRGFSLGGDLYVTDGSETNNGSSSTLYTCNPSTGVLTAPNGRNPAKVAACPDGASDNGCIAGVHIKVDDQGFFGDGVVAALNFGPVHFRAPTSCGTGDDQISSPVGACFRIEITKTGALLKVAGGVYLGGTETAGYTDGYASGQFALNICAGAGTCPNSTGSGSGGLARLQFYGRVGFGLPSATSCTAGTGIFCFHALAYGELDLPDINDLKDLFSGASTSLGGGLTLHFELATKSTNQDTSTLDYANSVQGQIDAKFQSALASLDQAKQWADKMATDPKGAIEDVKTYLTAHHASSQAVNDALTALQVMIDTNGGSLPSSVDWIFNGFTIPGIPGSITDCLGFYVGSTCVGVPIPPTCFNVMVGGTCWFTPPIQVPGLCQDLDIPDANGGRCSQADVVKALVLIPIAKTVSGLATASQAIVQAAQDAVDAFVSGEVFGVNCASLDLQLGTTSLGSGDTINIGMDLVVFGAPIKFVFEWNFDASWQTNANNLYANIMEAVSGNATVDTCDDASFDDVFGSGTSSGGTGETGGTTPAAALMNLSLTPAVQEGGVATLTGTFDHALESERTIDVNWGDGSAIAHIGVASAATTFTATHAYNDDNPTSTAADLMSVEANDTSTGGATIVKTLYVNNVAPTVSTTLTTGSIDENGTTGLTVNFTDPGAPDTHSATVTWGDGSSTTVRLAAGVLTTGQLNHQYKDNPVPAGSFTIGVSVADDDTGTGTATTSVAVANVAPTVSTGSFTPTTVNEGNQVTFTLGWSDPGSLDGHFVQIDLDGNGIFDLATSAPAGVSSATFAGLYLDDDPSGTESDVTNVGVRVMDKDTAVSSPATIPVTVNNVTPVIDSVTPSDADEGRGQTFTALFHDRGLLDTHTASFTWGDGTSDTTATVSDAPGFEISATGGTFTLSFKTGGGVATTSPIAVGATAAQVESALGALSTIGGTGNVDVARSGVDGDYLYSVTLRPATRLGLSVDGASLTGPSPGAFVEAMGVATATHTFVDDNPTGTASDPSNVMVTITDDDTGSTNATDVVTVHNLAPTFTSFTPATANEGAAVTYTLTFGDAGVADTHAVSIDWNDGGVGHGANVQNLATLGAGVTSKTVTHTFIDDDPTATTHDSYDVVVTITDDDTGTIVTHVPVDVHNVAPSITGIQVGQTGSPVVPDQHTVTVPENTSVTLSGSFHDPGLRDAFTLTAGWGNEACTQTTSGVPSCGPPQVTVSNVAITGFNATTGNGTFSATATFGDNGLFPLTAWVTDDDGGVDSSTAASVTVANVEPRPLIDTTGAVTGDGGDPIVDPTTGGTLGDKDSASSTITDPHESPVFLVTKGLPLAMSAHVTDPGSDDVAMTWNWDLWHSPALTSPPQTQMSLVNGPTAEPAVPSWTPTVQPRSYDDPRTHTWAQPCLYTVLTTATDDDGGVLTDRIDVVVQNTSSPKQGLGWWWNETKSGVQNLSDTSIQCYLDIAGRMSRVFNEVYDAHTISSTTAGHGAAFYLNTAGTSDPKRALGRAVLGAWLNFANGAFRWTTLVDTNGDSIGDTPFNNVMTTAENVFLNKNSSKQQLLAQKSILMSMSGE